MIQRAWRAWNTQRDQYDSLRAVEPVSQHAGKMWRITAAGYLEPLLLQPEPQPWHSSQMATLPRLFIQNASLELGWSRVPMSKGTIAGEKIMPFLSQGYEGMDINQPIDFELAELLVQKGLVALPSVSVEAASAP